VAYHDPLVPQIHTPQGQVLSNAVAPCGVSWDLAVIHGVHPDTDYGWVRDCPRVLDATYLFDDLAGGSGQRGPQRSVV
jgi:hypothetical protein